MQFYLVFGFAFAFLSRRTLVAGLIGLLFLAPLLRWAGGMWLDNAGFVPLRAAFAVYTFSPMHFDSFAFGCLLALAPSPWRKSRRSIALLLAGMAAMAVYAAFYVCVNHVHHAAGLKMLKNVISGILFGEGRQIWLYTTVAVLSAGVLATTLGGQAPWAIATRSPLVQAVGRASYGGYLYHAFCVTQARALLRATIHFGPGPIGKLEFGLGVFALALPATIAVSLFSYHYVERPVIAAANRRLARSAGS